MIFKLIEMPITSMSFLRPSALPKPSFVRNIFRSLTTQSSSTSAATATYTPPHLSSSSQFPESSEDTSSGSLETKSLPYHVGRTPSKQLPVYHINRRQGLLKQTRLRGITGSIMDLRNDLKEGLKLEDGHIKVNQLTNHIIIKGWKKHEIARFLRERQF